MVQLVTELYGFLYGSKLELYAHVFTLASHYSLFASQNEILRIL